MLIVLSTSLGIVDSILTFLPHILGCETDVAYEPRPLVELAGLVLAHNDNQYDLQEVCRPFSSRQQTGSCAIQSTQILLIAAFVVQHMSAMTRAKSCNCVEVRQREIDHRRLSGPTDQFAVIWCHSDHHCSIVEET